MVMFRSLQGSLLAHRPHLDSGPAAAAPSAVPVTLLTGFLGAGKSMLLAALLTSPPDGCVVRAVVNDVGRLPFDPTLIAPDGELEVELTNGCGCCGDSGDLGQTLANLARASPDVLVLEASGIADPFALAQIVEADPGLRLDRIVAVVDGTSVETQRADPMLGPVLRRQVEAAQVVVISHADRLSRQQLLDVTDQLAVIAPGRTIVGSALQDPATAMLLPGSVRGAALPCDSTAPAHELITVTAEQTASVPVTEIARALDALPESVVRCKGLLRSPAGSVLVQATQSGAQVTPTDVLDGEPGDRWHGVTIVGTNRTEVHDAVKALGCPIA